MNGQRITLFEQLNLLIKAGQSYAIVGPSGAGKSSLLTLMAGLEAPKAGSIDFTLSGKTANKADFRSHSGFIFSTIPSAPRIRCLGQYCAAFEITRR